MPRIIRHEEIAAIGHRLRAKRQWHFMTLAEVAALVGSAHQQIQKYETGLNEPRATVLIKLARAVKTTPHHLLGWDAPADNDPAAAKFFADQTVAGIVRRLRGMDGPQRRLAHSLICSLDKS